MTFLGRSSKISAILFVPVALLISGNALIACAEDPGVVKQATSPATQDGLHPVEFTEMVPADIVAKYPFLKEEASAQEDTSIPAGMPGAPPDGKAHMYVAAIKDAATKMDVVMLNIQSPSFCGTLGCSFYIYANSDKGYRMVANLIVPGDVSFLKQGKKIALVFDTRAGGKDLWEFKNGSFDYSKAYNEEPKAEK
jgi:hypothetical protein